MMDMLKYIKINNNCYEKSLLWTKFLGRTPFSFSDLKFKNHNAPRSIYSVI